MKILIIRGGAKKKQTKNEMREKVSERMKKKKYDGKTFLWEIF